MCGHNTQEIGSCYKEVTNEILGVGSTQNIAQIRYTDMENQALCRSGEIWHRTKE